MTAILTAEDRALVEQLRAIAAQATSLADALERPDVPVWPAETLERLQALSLAANQAHSERRWRARR